MRKNIFSKLKSVLASAAAVVMAVGLTVAPAIPVAAAEGDVTLTIRNSGETSHTFEIYQVFTGTVSGGTLTGIEWGTGVSDAGKTHYGTASVKAATLTNENVRTFAEEIASTYLGTKTGNDVTVAAGATGTATVAPGYYLVKDTADSQTGEKSAYTAYILKLTGSAEYETKVAVPTLEKKVADANDTSGVAVVDPKNVASGDWKDSADYDIGDTIPYQLTATLPSQYSDYKQYKMVFTDTMTHLTYVNNSAKVYLNGTNGTDITDKITGTDGSIAWDATNKVLTVTINDLKALASTNSWTISNSDTIVVQYQATLDADATIGEAGNPNVAKLTYSNNPNQNATGTPDTGETPEDKNIVFTYKVQANKYFDSVNDANKLNNTTWKLYKEKATTTANVYEVVEVTGLTVNNNVISASGLDDGTYILQEQSAPAGYNKITGTVTVSTASGNATYANAVEFTISAEHTDGQTPALTSVTATQKSGYSPLNLGTLTEDGKKTGVTMNIVDPSESSLPATGGIGTTVFYIVGLALIAGAAALLVVKKRRNA